MNRVKTIIWILTFLGALVFVGYHHQKLEVLLTISFLDFLLLFLLSTLAIFPLALSFKSLMQIFQIKLPFQEWFGLTVVNTMYNYYLPIRGGLIARAVYLKKQYQFPYAKYVSLLAGSYLIHYFLTALVLLLCLFFSSENKPFDEWLYHFSVAICALTIFIFLILNHLKKKKFEWKDGRIQNAIRNVLQGISYIQKNRRDLFFVIIYQGLFILVFALRLYFSFHAVGIPTDFLQMVIVQCVVIYSMLLAVTPGNLGIKEGVIILFTTSFGLSLEEAFLGSLVDRGISMLATFGFGLPYSRILLKNAAMSPEEKK